MKLVFFGSSDFSIPVLSALLNSSHQIELVVTTPPKKKGRGQKESKSIVHDWALSHSLACTAPADIKSLDFCGELKKLSPDCFVVASYGKILPNSILKIPIKFPINVHPSLLPKYRGAAPIARQLLNGETHSGVTLAAITEKLDAGEIMAQQEIDIQENDDALSLGKTLAELGGALALRVLDQIKQNKVELHPQNEKEATYAFKFTKEMGKINWNESAGRIHNQIRAFVPWPSAYTFWKKARIKILKSEKSEISGKNQPPATILEIHKDGFMRVQAKSSSVRIHCVQPESGKSMSAHAFAIGRKIKVGDQFA